MRMSSGRVQTRRRRDRNPHPPWVIALPGGLEGHDSSRLVSRARYLAPVSTDSSRAPTRWEGPDEEQAVPSRRTQERDAPGPASQGRRKGRLLTVAGLTVFAAATVALVWTQGLILSRDWLFGWLLLGLLAVSLADPVRWARGVVVDWLPLMVVLLCYDLSLPVRDWAGDQASRLAPTGRRPARLRPAADNLAPAPALRRPGRPLVRLPGLRRLSVPLLRHAAGSGAALEAVVRALPALPGSRRHAGHGGLRDVRALPGRPAVACCRRRLHRAGTARDRRHVGTTGVAPAKALFENHGEFYNQEAAIPSLHAAYPMLLLLFFWGAGRWARAGLIAYVLAMAFTLVYSRRALRGRHPHRLAVRRGRRRGRGVGAAPPGSTTATVSATSARTSTALKAHDARPGGSRTSTPSGVGRVILRRSEGLGIFQLGQPDPGTVLGCPRRGAAPAGGPRSASGGRNAHGEA